eukprot:TRINITY_DN2630_c0_g1_i1.p1 TRINITY_DN2630_c0_g1~~TRINITY_DN2630_c0_g1_i1.p1  ORF type:complete len:575 (+),score=87.19 TRINITY_DN2630_c0_g1_i1:47-1726(+)
MKRITVLLCTTATVHSLNNGLGKLPGLGWNSDYCVNCSKNANGFQNEVFIKELATYMHTHVLPCGKTFQQLGYNYVNMDASWNLKTRSASGELQPDPALWPSGMDNTVDFVHSLGMGFGLYGDRGAKDCAGNPGAEGHVTADAQFLAKNKIDWYKEDSCDNDTPTQKGAIAQYAQMRDALNQTGRPIWFALCGWEPWYASDPQGGKVLGNSARVGPDTGQGWEAVMTNVNNAASVSSYSGPTEAGGYWNDGSLMLCPGYINGGGVAPPEKAITNVRHRSQFNLWCVLALNILLTGNLSALNSYVIDTWSNEELLAINQDPLGIAGVKLPVQTSISSSLTKASVAECGGEPDQQKWVLNWGLPGFIHNDVSNTCLNVADCKTDLIYDSCVTKGNTCGGGHDSFHPNEEWFLTNDNQLQSNITGKPCATLKQDGSIVMEPCQSPVPKNQFWNHTKQGGQLVTGDGRCLTASSGPSNETALIIGRPLQDAAFAMVFLNNDVKHPSMNITCGSDCIKELGVPTGFIIRDLWEKVDVGTVSEEGFTVEVPGSGASRVFKLTKPF